MSQTAARQLSFHEPPHARGHRALDSFAQQPRKGKGNEREGEREGEGKNELLKLRKNTEVAGGTTSPRSCQGLAARRIPEKRSACKLYLQTKRRAFAVASVCLKKRLLRGGAHRQHQLQSHLLSEAMETERWDQKGEKDPTRLPTRLPRKSPSRLACSCLRKRPTRGSAKARWRPHSHSRFIVFLCSATLRGAQAQEELAASGPESPSAFCFVPRLGRPRPSSATGGPSRSWKGTSTMLSYAIGA